MPKFFVSPNDVRGNFLTLDGENAAHAKVLRLRRGDSVLVCDGCGTDCHCTVSDISPQQVCLVVNSTEASGAEPLVACSVYMAYAKADKLEHVIQKATELGAYEIAAFPSSRCVLKLDAASAEKRRERWQKIAREACKQSGRCQMMAVDAPIAFPALLAALKTHEAAIVPWEDARGYSLTAFHREHPEIHDLAIVIGPEGGMSADEIARMKDCGCQSVTLGPRILRTETAGLCALSALFCLYGELE